MLWAYVVGMLARIQLCVQDLLRCVLRTSFRLFWSMPLCATDAMRVLLVCSWCEIVNGCYFWSIAFTRPRLSLRHGRCGINGFTHYRTVRAWNRREYNDESRLANATTTFFWLVGTGAGQQRTKSWNLNMETMQSY